MVAFDATDRVRPVPFEELVKAVKAKGKLTMADCSSLEDARRALAAGVDFIGTTLSGYVGGPEPVEPDVALVAEMRKLTLMSSRRAKSVPEQAAEAVRAGACCVVVGSAITRTEHVTSWFHDTISELLRSAWRAQRDRACNRHRRHQNHGRLVKWRQGHRGNCRSDRSHECAGCLARGTREGHGRLAWPLFPHLHRRHRLC